jgi:hypothetical protein
MPDTPKLIFKPDVIDSFANNPNHPFRLALQQNDVYKWVPQAPMTLVHCHNDRQVPIQNSWNAYNYFLQHGAAQIDTFDPNPLLGHGDCGEFYFIFLKDYLDTVLAANTCLTDVTNLQVEDVINVFPNPSHGEVTISNSHFALQSKSEIEIYDAIGRKIFSKLLNIETFKIKTEGWSPGVYFLQYDISTGKRTKRMVIE